MESRALFAVTCVLGLLLISWQHPMPTFPHFPTPEQQHPLPGVDEPPVVVRGNRRLGVSPTQLRQQADELAKLAQSIPPDLDRVAGGKLPQDLTARLKQIEKLSKQMRNELSR